MMITVATSLEAPIKLVFPGPARGSMLGLGDIVLPGLMIALALRFDLYLHYLRHPTLATVSSDPTNKSPYVDATGKWGERYWTWGAKGEPTATEAARFQKVYFKASMIGYVIGLITTLIVLNIFQHGQPALFYLVPSVLGSLWGTALTKGDLSLMWGYTEDGSLNQDETEKGKEAKNVSSTVSPGTESTDSTMTKNGELTHNSADKSEAVESKAAKQDDHAQHVFLFSLTAPKERKKAFLLDKSS